MAAEASRVAATGLWSGAWKSFANKQASFSRMFSWWPTGLEHSRQRDFPVLAQRWEVAWPLWGTVGDSGDLGPRGAEAGIKQTEELGLPQPLTGVWAVSDVDSKVCPKCTHPWDRKWLAERTAWRFLREKGVEGETEWEFGVRRCQVLFVGWIISKVLPYSTENRIQ